MLYNGVFRFWNFLDFGAYVIFDFWDGIVYYFLCFSGKKRQMADKSLLLSEFE